MNRCQLTSVVDIFIRVTHKKYHNIDCTSNVFLFFYNITNSALQVWQGV